MTLFEKLAGNAVRSLAADDLEIQSRFGIDAGVCVAIDNGTPKEREPLFLGSPANHAAKLADASKPDIFVSDQVRFVLGNPGIGTLLETSLPIETSSVKRAIDARAASLGIAAFAEDQRSRTIAHDRNYS